MSGIVTAIYENGVLRLLTPLELPDQTRVRVHVEPMDDEFASPVDVGSEMDSLFDLIGAYSSSVPLIDGIPVSEDPDLYLIAAKLDAQALDRHAWEIAPDRYTQGPEGRPIRRDLVEVVE